MSIFKNEYISSQSVTKSINSIARSARIDLALSHYPYINCGRSYGDIKDSLANRISDAAVIVIITENNEVAMANNDIVLYRNSSHGRLNSVAYSRTSNDEIQLFLNSPKGKYHVKSSRSAVLE